jgi:foldase protein PrsA
MAVTGCSKKKAATDDTKTTDTNTTGTTGEKVDTSIKYKTDDLVLTVDDYKMTMADMLYYIFSYESQIDYLDQMYTYYTGSGYWDMEIEDGVTVREKSKQETMDTAIRYEVLYKEAVKANYTLTDDEKKEIEDNTATTLSQLDEATLKLTGFSEEGIKAVQEKWKLADKYVADLIKSYNLDYDAIKASVDKDKYKQYDTEYVFVSTQKTDDQGTATAMTDAEKADAKAKIDEVYKKVQAGDDFAKAIGENTDKVFSTSELSFYPNDEQETTDKAFMDAAMKLKNDEISGVVEAANGYYIIKMVDNNSSEAYDKAVKDANTAAEQERLDKEFVGIKEKYTVEINNDVWDKVVMGNNTIIAADPAATGAATDATAVDPAATDATTTDDAAATNDATATDNATTDDAAAGDSGNK